MTLRRAGRLLTVLPVVVAWLDASTAWCFCTRVLAAVVAPELAVNPAPAPTSPRMVPPPAVVLRI